MNQQSTAILLKFTDFLDNRDSLAFLRLSSSIWYSHRQSAGRYRLKSKIILFTDGQFGVRPSCLPRSFFVNSSNCPDSFSPSGNFQVNSLALISQDDLRIFNEHLSIRKPSVEQQGNERKQPIPSDHRLFDPITSLYVNFASSNFYGLLNSTTDKGKMEFLGLPESLKTLKLGNLASLEKLFPYRKESLINDSSSSSSSSSIWISPSLNTLDLSQMKWNENSSQSLLNHPIIHWNSLEILYLPNEFNCPLLEENSPSFPATLKELYIKSSTFSSPISSGGLPNSLQSLYLSSGMIMNYPLPCPLASGLITLDLDIYLCQPLLPGHLPDSLKIIRVHQYYSHMIGSNVFPQGLEEIIFHEPYQLPLGIIPSSVKRLQFHWSPTSSMSSDPLPAALESLKLSFQGNYNGPLPKWPESLKSLEFEHFNAPIESIDFFPPQLRSIDFGSFNQEIKPGIFPSTVEEIFLPGYNQPIEVNVFPPGLKKISFGVYDHPLPVGIFPDGIISIELGDQYSHRLEAGLFPSSVRELQIMTKSRILPGVFSEGVESITFSGNFNEPLQPIFPSSLRRLSFLGGGNSFQQKLVPGVLPEFLSDFNLGSSYYGDFSFSSLPSYFRPDFLHSTEKVLLRWNPEDHSPVPKAAKALMKRYGEGEFLLNSLRVSIGPVKDYYFVLSSVSADFPPFIAHHSIIQRK